MQEACPGVVTDLYVPASHSKHFVLLAAGTAPAGQMTAAVAEQLCPSGLYIIKKKKLEAFR